MNNIYICIIVFFFLLWFNYKGAKGRIEGRNQFNGASQELGSVSEKDIESLWQGTHKKRAFIQALIGSFIWVVLLYAVLYFVN